MVEDIEYEEAEEEEEDDLEDNVEDQFNKTQELYEEHSPSSKQKDDLYSLFWKVIKIADSSKVGNLNNTELGMLNLSVRDCQKISLLADTLGHRGFSTFFWAQAQITLRTSSSKEGWLPELFVSQRKFTKKSREKKLSISTQPRRKKGFLK